MVTGVSNGLLLVVLFILLIGTVSGFQNLSSCLCKVVRVLFLFCYEGESISFWKNPRNGTPTIEKTLLLLSAIPH